MVNLCSQNEQTTTFCKNNLFPRLNIILQECTSTQTTSESNYNSREHYGLDPRGIYAGKIPSLGRFTSGSPASCI